MQDLARILFAAVMGASMTLGLLTVPAIARGSRGAAVPVATAVMLLGWLAAAVAAASTGHHAVVAAPALAVGLSALWLGVAPLRRAWEGAPMAAVVGLQALRVEGAARVLAVRGGWLPSAYGTSLGAADVALGLGAIALAWGWSKGAPWARGATLAYSLVAAAVTLGGLAVQSRLVRPMPGFEGLWSTFTTPVLLALLAVAALRASRRG